ncbi:MAG: hypothetical protein J0H49_22600 [Acidobacteria bacterium]|nr:hypothetical protein [Acidobacteriota bacterium]
MPITIGNTPVTTWSLMAAHKALAAYKATIERFAGSEVTIRFASIEAAAAALANPAQANAMQFGIGVQPQTPANRSINDCLADLEVELDRKAKQARQPDKEKYNKMLAEAGEAGALLFSEAAKNKPELFAARNCVYYYQGGYMSGDQFAVGAALAFDGTARLILLYAEADRNAAARLVRFYAASCRLTKDRLLVVQVPNAKDAVESCRQLVDHRIDADKPMPDLPDGLKFLLKIPARGAKLCPVGGATTDVAASVMSGKGDQIVAKWDGVDPNKNRYWAYRVDKFLNLKGIVKGQKYVILWMRFSGKEGGAHKELDDSWTGLGQICHAFLKKQRNVILVGRPRQNRDVHAKMKQHLDKLSANDPVDRDRLKIWGEYWKSEGGNPNTKIIGPNRAAEYAIFLRMKSAEWKCSLVHLGMRSGAMDAAALLGMHTRFIEQAGNEQIKRTTKWTGKDNTSTLYKRAEVSELSTKTARDMVHDGGQHGIERGYTPEDLKLIIDSVESAFV